jgi:hypothetical protein
LRNITDVLHKNGVPFFPPSFRAAFTVFSSTIVPMIVERVANVAAITEAE